MLSVVKLIAAFIFLVSTLPSSAREIYILVAGQSNSSDCKEYVHKNFPGVYQIGLDGEEKLAADSFGWADCGRGSMWMPLGEHLIRSGFATKVFFMPIAIGGTFVQDWLPYGKAYDKLLRDIAIVNRKQVKFNYALWYQDSSDIGRQPTKYRKQLAGLLKFISLNVPIDKWIIAQHSRCGNEVDSKIAKEQYVIGYAFHLKRFLGPNTNSLGDEYRYDGCHLNKKGQEEMAKLWLQSIIEAERVDDLVQKESLLYYFRKILN